MKLLHWPFRRREPDWQRPEPPASVTLHAVGYVRSPVVRPRPHGWANVESTVEFLPEHAGRLEGLERYSDVIVVTYLDVAADAPQKPERMRLADGLEYGIFATRSQLRPNHLGVTVAAVLGRDGLMLRLRGLDAIDRTPVLDVKPYFSEHDSRP